MADQKRQKSLSEVFKELERDKDKQVQIYKDNQRAKREASFMFHVKQRTKKDNIFYKYCLKIIFYLHTEHVTSYC